MHLAADPAPQRYLHRRACPFQSQGVSVTQRAGCCPRHRALLLDGHRVVDGWMTLLSNCFFTGAKFSRQNKKSRAEYSSMFSIAEHFGADQQTTKLLLGNKSERAQKVFALDYCSGAFVTEGASPGPPAPSAPAAPPSWGWTCWKRRGEL